MADPLPYLRNTNGTLYAQVLYPFTRLVSFQTTVNIFAGGQEQRWPERTLFHNFDLKMQKLNLTDQQAWLAYFTNVAQGRYVQDLQITIGVPIGSPVFSNLAMLSDDLSQTNIVAQLFNQAIRLRQTSNLSWSPTTPGSTYPTLSTIGAIAEQPFTTTTSFLTGYNDNPLGTPFVYEYFGTGRPNTNFPNTPLKRWHIEYPLLNAADMAQLEAFFTSTMGKTFSFSFTDPVTGTVYSHVRFDTDTLEVKYNTLNQFSTSVDLWQTNGS